MKGLLSVALCKRRQWHLCNPPFSAGDVYLLSIKEPQLLSLASLAQGLELCVELDGP